MPGEKSVKRGRGRPHGVKDRKPRRFKPRLVVPLEQQILSKREAAAVAGIGLSKIDENLKAIGAVRSGSRVLIFRERLMAWVHSLPPAVPSTVTPPGLPVAAAEISELIERGAPRLGAGSIARAGLGDLQTDAAIAECGKPDDGVGSPFSPSQNLERDSQLNEGVSATPAKKMRR
jgi:hypothetical protein